jgi:soluble lytic murein transglycosylase-like protein
MMGGAINMTRASLLMFIVVFAAAWAVRAEAADRKTEVASYIDYARQVEKQFNLPDKLVTSICSAETDWRPKEIGKAGEIGVCQMMPGTLAMFTSDDPKELLDPFYAIYYAGVYLQYLIKKLGTRDPDILAAAYNGGPNHPIVKYMIRVRGRR